MATTQSPPAKVEVDPRNHAGLTPPASDESDKNDRKDDSGSELSDLDEPNAEIEPDHYWDGGKIPVFKPVGNPTPHLRYGTGCGFYIEFLLITLFVIRPWTSSAASSRSSPRLTSTG